MWEIDRHRQFFLSRRNAPTPLLPKKYPGMLSGGMPYVLRRPHKAAMLRIWVRGILVWPECGEMTKGGGVRPFGTRQSDRHLIQRGFLSRFSPRRTIPQMTLHIGYWNTQQDAVLSSRPTNIMSWGGKANPRTMLFYWAIASSTTAFLPTTSKESSSPGKQRTRGAMTFFPSGKMTAVCR